ncbi:MAG: hypothetical protein QME61_00350 [Patescibacteria group bacterium]|nr:hypothetical protein [Patescibacteria group bacterium]
MLKFSLFQKKKIKCFLAIDIGTEAVKALVFKKEDKKIVILGSSLQYFDKFSVFDSRDFEVDVIKKAISKAIEEAEKEAKEKPEGIFLGLPANILRGKVIFQNFKREDSKKLIDKKEEKEIYQTVLKDGQKKISEDFARESGILPEEIQFLKAEILETKIDGYNVPELLKFSGKQLEFGIFFIFFPKHYLNNFKKISQDLNLRIFDICHQAQGLTNFFEGADAIFLDIGGEISQIFLTIGGKLKLVDIFNIGGKNFSQILSENLGLREERAKLLKERYSKGEISKEIQKRIKEIFVPVIQDWFENLKLKLQKTLLPSSIFLFGGGSLLPEIAEILTKGNWGELSFFNKPEVKFLSLKDLKNIEDITKTLNNPQFTPTLFLCYTS